MIAPGRAARPGAFFRPELPPGDAELDSCPFCAGREDRTPPETLRFPAKGQWQVRAFLNLFPAFPAQEVVVHVRRHARSIADLSDNELARVALAWQARAQSRDGYLHAFVNEGAEAGSSLPHTHSQLVWLDEPPPEVAREKVAEQCSLCDDPGGEALLLASRGGVSLRVAWAGRVPYELLIAPTGHDGNPWAGNRLALALQLAAEGIRRIRNLEGAVPVNLWLHRAAGHWHLELVPRLTVLAGVELGAGIFVNALSPEAAAERLRH